MLEVFFAWNKRMLWKYNNAKSFFFKFTVDVIRFGLCKRSYRVCSCTLVGSKEEGRRQISLQYTIKFNLKDWFDKICRITGNWNEKLPGACGVRTILAQTTGGSFEKKSFILSFWCLFKELTTSVAIKLVDTVESPGANLVSNIAFRRFIPLWETTEC